MKVWVVFLYDTQYPYRVEEYHLFTTEDKWRAFMENYYDTYYKPDYEKGYYRHDGWNSYEEMRESYIMSNDNEYIEWEIRELE